MRLLLLIALSILLMPSVNAQKSTAPTKDSVEVKKTVDGFLDAFSNLRWEEFRSYFANDVQMFFPPSAKTRTRANNKMEVERIFKNVFENARKGKTGPPYLTIQPNDLRIQIIEGVAIVTFHLLDPGAFGRRTVVLTRDGTGEWKIVHIHASAITE
jgi:ketosteroid isomerase-like protein